MIPALLPSGIPANVQNVAQPSKKAQQHITGLLMANSIVYPAANLNTVSFSLPQLMKLFIRAPAIQLPANFRNFYHPARLFPGFFVLTQLNFESI